jgi:hypothetical protein
MGADTLVVKQHESKQQVSAIQSQLFERIASGLTSPKDLASEVTNTLGISIHGAYRRLRGEVVLSINEVELLVKKYKVPLFNGLDESPTNYLFQGVDLSLANHNFLERLQANISRYKQINQHGQLHMYYLGIDISPASLHFSPVLLMFLDYFWRNCYLNNHIRCDEPFSAKVIPAHIQQIADESFEIHQHTRTTEIWSLLCLESFIHQMEYMQSMHLFASDDDFQLVCDELDKTLHFYQQQAHIGYKLDRSGQVISPAIPFELYYSDLFFSENLFYLKINNDGAAVIKHNLFYLSTAHVHFVKNVKDTFDIMLTKASPISGTNEKGRIYFFNKLFQRINYGRKK